jgi:hypothetical protein
MSLTLFGFPGKPHDVGVSKTSAEPSECSFLLDLARPVERIRWFAVRNTLFGPTVALLVPVVHVGEKGGGLVFGVSRGEPYFEDIPNLWHKHHAAPRTLFADPVDGLQVVADFARHFPEDSA